ncbi:outer membrane receptor protein involved in Fe transport [Sphingobium sp. JAI105]|uniref:TonB-dependent receptor plug domain-containing protein n=1 Tax=Sphingobium sp. JAI105 TaxID=2787715 RepID=UPI0018CB57DB|nr:TonB-dependent receptor [Sphingobium sp. JAI105]MBG6120219.1 outer membrane receptor protein involved in Fe transport [Sphingobium sp. JAI105]
MRLNSGPKIREQNARQKFVRRGLMGATALSMLSMGAPAMAQDAPGPDASAQGAPVQDTPAEGAPAQDIIVTASRVNRTGFTAPTPTTVLNATELQRRAPNNVSEVLNELPSFRGGSSPNNQSLSLSLSGQTYLDLRGIGNQRTLVLVNGRRVTPSSLAGQVDVNVIPSSLVENIEIVTGGASASWGSDAVAGVANIILKKKVQGVEASAQYGISERGDSENYTFSGAAGTGFMGGRGHITIGGEYSRDKGIGYEGVLKRQDWIKNRGAVANGACATNGLPCTIYTEDLQYADQAPGGLINRPVLLGGAANAAADAATTLAFNNSGLRGTTFNADGSTGRLQYGQVFGGFMIGGGQPGNNPVAYQPYRAPVERWNVLARLDFEVTDGLNFNIEASDAHSTAEYVAVPPRDTSLVARVDNPFLPASVRATMLSFGLNAVIMGRDGYDLDGNIENIERVRSANHNQRITVGLDGELGIGNWKWDAYYQYGRNTVDETRSGNNRIMAKYRQAIDVVAGPNGPICRSTLTNPADGCVPFNMFGVGAPSAAALAYTTGVGKLDSKYIQQVASASVTGDLFNLPAGPISAALGAEYRKERANQVVDAVSQAFGFEFANQQPLKGGFSVKEAFGELVLPILKDSRFGRAMDLQLAGRYTDYSTSGSVATWKAGLTWDVNDQFKLRGAVSRDIRAGNINELFTLQAASPFQPVDRVLNIPTGPISSIAGGNPNLDPERATTFTVGMVLRPEWLPGFRFSVDYFNISIDDVIARVDGQTIINRCAEGLTEYCNQIDRNPDRSLRQVRSPFLNLNSFQTNGLDFEMVYARPAAFLPWGGDFVLRALATYTNELSTTDPVTTIDRAGQLGSAFGGANVPHWLGSATLTYNLKNFSTSLQGRYIDGGNIDNLAIPGTRTSANIYTVPAKTIWSLAVSYDIVNSGGRKVQIFGNINNLFDSNPPFPLQPSSALTGPYYDGIGRAFRFGIRVKG